MMRKLYPLLGLLIFPVFNGCQHFYSSEVYWNNNTSKKIVLSWNFGDCDVRLIMGNQDVFLFSLYYADSNERILKYSTSPSETKIAFLVNNSTKKEYPSGTYLLVFDISTIQTGNGNIIPIYQNKIDNITDFSLTDSGITYIINGSSQTIITFSE